MPCCLYCETAPADLGRYCSGCYGWVFHEDGAPLVVGDPNDPWRDFNADADRYIADVKAHAVLWPRKLRAAAFRAMLTERSVKDLKK